MDPERIGAAVQWAAAELSRAFPGSFPDTGTAAETMKLYTSLLNEHPWIDAGIWKAGVRHVCWHHMGNFAPPPAVIIQACREHRREAERKAESERVLNALPAPRREGGYPRERWNWHYAKGSLIQRARNDGRGEIQPSDAEIAAQVERLIADGRLQRPAEAPVLRVPELAGAAPAWPGAAV